MNRYILFFFKDKTSLITLIKPGESFDESFFNVLRKKGKAESSVKAKFELDSSNMPSEFYLPCLTLTEKNELIFNNSFIIDKHLEAFWIPMRNYLLKGLDIDYIRADESNDKEKKAHIVKRKEFLRDLPDFLVRTMAKSKNVRLSLDTRGESLEPVRVVDTMRMMTLSQQINLRKIFNKECSREKALKITPFYNVLDVKVIDGGSGYINEPKITIDCDYEAVLHPTLKVELVGGAVKNVKVISAGCGYVCEPAIKVSEPETPGGRTAILSTEVEYKLDNIKHGLPI